MTKNTSRSLYLDVIRLFAISLVAFAHIFQSIGNKSYGGFFGVHNFYWVSWGGVGVTIFLILSGFANGLKFSNKTISYQNYIKDRLLRIYPIYWVALVASIPIYIANIWYNTGNPPTSSSWPISDIACSLFGVCVFIGRWGGMFMDTAWFIGLIISIYLLYPYLQLQIKKHPQLTLLLTLIISILSRWYLGQVEFLPTRSQDWLITSRIFEFTLGVYLYHQLNPDNVKKFLELPSPPSIRILSNLSFPFFLIHHPLLFIIPHTIREGLPFIFAVIIYLTICIITSFIILSLARELMELVIRFLSLTTSETKNSN